MFSELMNDKIFVHARNGETITGPINASVQGNKIFLTDCKILIEDGFIIERVMSNGSKEKYRVLDAGFREEFGGHYQMKVQKILSGS